ncbi:CoA ester lyase [Falsirhodobacter sp. alg1]|uniref:HpcH/HpaI aldolase/citrate lyase family protein n=1 Tax=Falsirhodobacter sp. alg1 TaxID=1472418 RepID=UPI0007883A8C|nr:CoA ester lyase [Falsirhodobacter sp. alg1]
MPVRPLRSILYIPASNPRALEKARTLPCDGIIFDLEDAVSPTGKDTARDTLVPALRDTDYGHRLCLVRINPPDTSDGKADLAALAMLPIDGILLPKVSTPEDLEVEPPHPLWIMIETAKAVLNAAALAAHPRVAGLVMGTNDLQRELMIRDRPDRLGLLHALGQTILAARAAGKPVLDGVHTAYRDIAGLQAECEQGRDLGFDGKTLIHPAQLDVANTVFSPTIHDVERARAEIAAHAEATARGEGIAVHDGRIVENLHVAIAQRTIALAEAIARNS